MNSPVLPVAQITIEDVINKPTPFGSAPEVRQTELSSTALRVVNHISAMVAYWDADQRCVFANDAYQEWFGRNPNEMAGMHIKDLLGDLYEKNLPYIRGVLAGQKQIFERQIPVSGGLIRESIATYTPDIVDGRIHGFSVHVADVTRLRQREAALASSVNAAIDVLEKTKSSFRSKELGILRKQLTSMLAQLKTP